MEPLAGETDEDKIAAQKILVRMKTAYSKQRRDNLEGTRNLDEYIELREEYYSFGFILQIKRKELFGDGYDSDDAQQGPNRFSRVSRPFSSPDDLDREDKEELRKLNQFYKNYQTERKNAAGKTLFLFCCQMGMTYLLLSEFWYDDDFRADFFSAPESFAISFTRFLCAILLHVSLQEEIIQGQKIMKFAANHPWKFRSYKVAFMIGFAQMFMVVSVEIVNLVVLNTNNTVMDILMNFLALVIISEFDDTLFWTVTHHPIAKFISDQEMNVSKKVGEKNAKMITIKDVFKNQVTSSTGARFRIDANKFEEVHGQKEEEESKAAGDRSAGAQANSNAGSYRAPQQTIRNVQNEE